MQQGSGRDVLAPPGTGIPFVQGWVRGQHPRPNDSTWEPNSGICLMACMRVACGPSVCQANAWIIRKLGFARFGAQTPAPVGALELVAA
jgi:hypothetical protein